MPTAVPPRVHAQVAARAPVAAVFRRGPASWWHVGRWDLVGGAYEPGARLRGGLYPRRGDLSAALVIRAPIRAGPARARHG